MNGEFLIKAVKIENWENPNKESTILEFELTAETNNILVIPGGYANGIINTAQNSQLLVFSSLSLSDSQKDDHRYELNYFKNCNWPDQ